MVQGEDMKKRLELYRREVFQYTGLFLVGFLAGVMIAKCRPGNMNGVRKQRLLIWLAGPLP